MTSYLSTKPDHLSKHLKLLIPHYQPLGDLEPLILSLKWFSVGLSSLSPFYLVQAQLILLIVFGLDRFSGLKSELVPLCNPTYSPPPK